MLLPLEMTPATLIIGLAIIGLVVLAIHRIRSRGLCDCDDHCGDSGCKGSGCTRCSGCSAAESMSARLDEFAKRQSSER